MWDCLETLVTAWSRPKPVMVIMSVMTFIVAWVTLDMLQHVEGHIDDSVWYDDVR